jgi:DUF4097 and DUF4098 domain-containing protein YvlB
MLRKNCLQLTILTPAILCLIFLSAFAQRTDRDERSLTCNDNWNGNRASHCVIKEQTIPASSGMIAVDGKKNGGVSVKGWDRVEIFIRSKIQAWADTEAEAQAIGGRIRIETSGGRIYAEGPATGNNQGWAVNYEIFVPRNSNLSLKSHNGGISIADVRGQIEFDALNGGVSLKRLAGNVKGHTTNGGLSIELAGNRWDGEGMNAKTTNGGVSMLIPEDYSARLETGTVNGGMKIDIPVTVQGKIERELAIDLGSGGAIVRATTTNGGVSIKRKGE